MADFAKVTAVLGLDASDFKSKFGEVDELLGGFASKAAKVATAVGAALVLKEAIQGVVNLTREAGKAAEAIQNMAQASGVSAQFIQGLQFTLEQAGLGADGATTAMRVLSQRMIEAQDTSSDAAKKFEQLGIAITDQSKAEDVINQIADAFTKMDDGAKKTALSVEFFGRAGSQLIPILNQGEAGLKRSGEEAAKFGVVLDQHALASLRAVDDAFDQLNAAIKGLTNELAIAFGPALKVVVQQLTELVVATRQFVASARELSVAEKINQAWATSTGDATYAQERATTMTVTGAAARGRAEEAAGRTIIAITQGQVQEREAAVESFGRQVEAERALQLIRLDVTMANTQARVSSEAQAMLAIDEAQRTALDAELAREARAEGMRQEFLGRKIVAETTAAQQSTGLWQQQLASMQQAATYAFGQIQFAFANSVAQMIVHGGTFQAFMSQMYVTLLSTAINMATQMLLNWIAVQLGLTTATTTGEAARTAAVVAGEGTRTTVHAASEATNVGITGAAAAATVSIWSGAAAAIVGAYATVAAGFAAITASLVGILTAVGTAIMGVLSAIAAALTKTIFGIPWAGAILLGVVGIAAALAALKVIPMAEGGSGIVNEPTLFLAGEAGREAFNFTPLGGGGQMGSSYKNDGYGFGQQTIIIELDGRTMTQVVLDHMPREVRVMGVPA